MKKTALFFAAALAMVATSCMKDDDFEAVKNLADVPISGGTDLSFAVPIGTGSVNAGELLARWQDLKSYVSFDRIAIKEGDSIDLVSINYDTTFNQTLNISSKKKKSGHLKASKDGSAGIDTVYRETYEDDYEIDLFDNFNFTDGALDSVMLKGLRALLSVNMKLLGEGIKAEARNNLGKYLDDPYIDEIELYTITEQGRRIELGSVSSALDHFSIDDLTNDGLTKTLIDENTDLGELLQNSDLPKKIHYKVRVNIPLKITVDEITQLIVSGEYEDIQNYMNAEIFDFQSFLININLKAHFPLQMGIHGTYNTDVDFDFGDISKSLDDIKEKLGGDVQCYLAVNFENYMPLSFTSEAYFADKDGKKIELNDKTVYLFRPSEKIYGAATVAVTHPYTTSAGVAAEENIYISNGKPGSSNPEYAAQGYTQKMLLQVSVDDLNKMQTEGAEQLIFKFRLDTDEGTGQQVVSFQSKDKLTTALYLLVNPDENYLLENFGANQWPFPQHQN